MSKYGNINQEEISYQNKNSYLKKEAIFNNSMCNIKESNKEKSNEQDESNFINIPKNENIRDSFPVVNSNSNYNHKNQIISEKNEKMTDSNKDSSNSTINKTHNNQNKTILDNKVNIKNSNFLSKSITNKIHSSMEEIIPKIKVYITNIVVIVDLHSELDIKSIADTLNIKYNEKNNFISMNIENSHSNALLFSSGKMRLTGVKSQEELTSILPKYKNRIKNCGFPSVYIENKEIKYENISAACDVEFKISLINLYKYLKISDTNSKVSYEPEIFPGLIYKKTKEESNLSLTIYHSGKIIITGAKREKHINEAFREIYPILIKFKFVLFFNVKK